ncbi:glycosyltransferase [Methylothermus subterraneus]
MAAVKASVVIPVKNGGELFARVLEAVMAQETPWPFEVLVIDSGSKDSSREVARSLKAKLHTIDPDQFGHGRTRNLGGQLTRGEYLVYITQDALPAGRDWLRTLVEPLERDARIAGAFGRHLPYPDCNPITARELEVHFSGFGSAVNVFAIDDWNRYRVDVGYRQFLHFFSNNNSCIRRSVWQEIPFPDVDFAEDQLWAKAVLEAGWRKAYVPSACVFHSHDFGVLETFRRAFDESRALKKYFGYDLVPSLNVLLYQWPRFILRDWGWVVQADLSGLERWQWYAEVPVRSLARLFGFWLGGTERLPDWVERRFSRDQALKSQSAG